MEVQFEKLNELMERYERVLSESGLGYATRLRLLNGACHLIKRHETAGCVIIDERIISEYFQDIDARLCEGRIGVMHHRKLTIDTVRFCSFIKTGSIGQASPLKGSRFELSAEFERIAKAFLESEEFHPNTRNDIRWVTHKYFAWLYEQGFQDMTGVGADELQKYLLDCTKHHPPSSLYNIKLFLKKLYSFLYVNGMSQSSYAELLSFRVNREVKIYPALPMDDVAKLLAAIDRSTALGKRAYAVMILGARLGLRASDVVKLKLDNIDWARGEIKVKQSKTGKLVILPLTGEVGEALYDYILNSRPKTSEQHVFLRFHGPHTPLKAAVTIGEIYRDCCKAAGFPDSKSFHTLRRSLATAMATNSVAVTTIAQVLGDSDVNSTKKYISLDSKHLKRCALPFDGISPAVVGGGV